MSDSIRVRVVLDSYDFAHPGEKQTAVHVQIPEVARATYMLPAERFHGLRDREWPEVVAVAHEHYERGWTVSDSASAEARAAIHAWLRDDANHDELQSAWELDQARRHPVARKLLKENERLRARVAELEAANARIISTGKRLGAALVARTEELMAAERRAPQAAESADKVTALFAPTQALGLEPGGAE